uniref:Uncharacterized protein n=1 Tax=Anguilla anguilla TaxID=7936 RepID=A0A0E9Q624_ANGAN
MLYRHWIIIHTLSLNVYSRLGLYGEQLLDSNKFSVMDSVVYSLKKHESMCLKKLVICP